MKWLWLVLFIGCNPYIQQDPIPERIIWQTYEGRATSPQIQWFDECIPFQREHCYEGVYLPHGNTVLVVWRGSWSSSEVAHEFLHAKLWMDENALDPDHELPEWMLVNRARERLKEAGY